MHLEKNRTNACTFPAQRKEINVVGQGSGQKSSRMLITFFRPEALSVSSSLPRNRRVRAHVYKGASRDDTKIYS